MTGDVKVFLRPELEEGETAVGLAREGAEEHNRSGGKSRGLVKGWRMWEPQSLSVGPGRSRPRRALHGVRLCGQEMRNHLRVRLCGQEMRNHSRLTGRGRECPGRAVRVTHNPRAQTSEEPWTQGTPREHHKLCRGPVTL